MGDELQIFKDALADLALLQEAIAGNETRPAADEIVGRLGSIQARLRSLLPPNPTPAQIPPAPLAGAGDPTGVAIGGLVGQGADRTLDVEPVVLPSGAEEPVTDGEVQGQVSDPSQSGGGVAEPGSPVEPAQGQDGERLPR